jgi:thiol-disulfide isomerase/thioredoxin
MATVPAFSMGTNQEDWRRSLFGDNIQINQDEEVASEQAKFIPVEEAFDTKRFDYIAVFIGADYCPHCKAFAPTVKEAVNDLEQKRCKVVFCSNDRTEEAFAASCKKNVGIDVVPYNLEKTRVMRDLFDLKTIPALMILKNAMFKARFPEVVTNGRNTLVADPHGKDFPWVSEGPMSALDRLIIRGKYGKWWELGHHVNPDFPDQVYMDEVSARAGYYAMDTVYIS